MLKKLIIQIAKFGFVGAISFVVDMGVFTLLCNVLELNYLFSGICSFVVSVIVNYILSMKYVFQPREGTSKIKEFVVFVCLSVIGLGLNSLILYVSVDVVYWNWIWLQGLISIKIHNILAKIAATGVVMIWNFVSRKIFLEKKE